LFDSSERSPLEQGVCRERATAARSRAGSARWCVTLQRDLHGSCKHAGGSKDNRNVKWSPSHQRCGAGWVRLGACFTPMLLSPFGSEASSSPGSVGALCVPSVGTCFPGTARCILQNGPGSGAEAALGTASLGRRGLPGH